jgi:hypothetical protein
MRDMHNDTLKERVTRTDLLDLGVDEPTNYTLLASGDPAELHDETTLGASLSQVSACIAKGHWSSHELSQYPLATHSPSITQFLAEWPKERSVTDRRGLYDSDEGGNEGLFCY